MEKRAILDHIIQSLEDDLANAQKAALEAAEEATDEESRPENKYDTRGLETSYLAGAQAHHAKALEESLAAYRNFAPKAFGPSDPVATGAIVTTLSSNGRERFFVGLAQGGQEIASPEGTITVITPQSPIGRQLIGKSVGGRASEGTPRTIIRIQ